ncbi:hypothetical protein [Methanobrevibacter sp.]
MCGEDSVAGILFVPLSIILEMETPEDREDSIKHYKERDPEGWEAYVEWCKQMEESTGEKYYY